MKDIIQRRLKDVIAQDIVIGRFQLGVLAAVNRLGSDAYGWKIRDFLRHELERDIHLAQIYAALKKLENLKLITSEINPTRGTKRREKIRRIYTVETKGRHILAAFDLSTLCVHERNNYEENGLGASLTA